ncbi:hypothetical protein F2Q70_00035824 [Brassica cretica]|uniref:Uncharacterized protein n=1 Tax=Brassica cretica TaxID=69181 RepID=A0A8S9JXM0_BRACR|nr:hypothetical protein F2Q70_00035824 [Brassica cretica]
MPRLAYELKTTAFLVGRCIEPLKPCTGRSFATKSCVVVSVSPSVASVSISPLYRRPSSSVPPHRPRSVVVCALASSSIRRWLRLCIVLDPSSSLYIIISCLCSDQDFRTMAEVFCVCRQWSSKESLMWEFNVDKNRNASFIYTKEDLQYENLMKMVSKDFRNTCQLISFIGKIRAFDGICRLCVKDITDSASCNKQTTDTYTSPAPLNAIPVFGYY